MDLVAALGATLGAALGVALGGADLGGAAFLVEAGLTSFSSLTSLGEDSFLASFTFPEIPVDMKEFQWRTLELLTEMTRTFGKREDALLLTSGDSSGEVSSVGRGRHVEFVSSSEEPMKRKQSVRSQTREVDHACTYFLIAGRETPDRVSSVFSAMHCYKRQEFSRSAQVIREHLDEATSGKREQGLVRSKSSGRGSTSRASISLDTTASRPIELKQA